MEIPTANASGPSFGERHFGAAALGDKRRTRRLVQLADRMMLHPGGTLPQKLADPMDLKALYRLMNAEAVTHAAVLKPHTEHTRKAMAQAGGTIVLIHDTTELDFTTKFALDGVGPIGKGTHMGFLCHNSLAVTAKDGCVLGLASQILHARPATAVKGGRKKKAKSLKASRNDPKRESRLWIQGLLNSGPAPEGVKVIDVCDRGADTFEVLAHEFAHNRSFVIRSTHNRRLQVDPKTHTGPVYLHQYARTLVKQGERHFRVQDNLARIGRDAVVGFAAAAVTLAVPKQKRGLYESKTITLRVVRVWELDPPKQAQSEKPLEWILLTREPCDTPQQTEAAIDFYQCRPIVEELHKGQKTGCNIEDMQFTRSERLQPAIALLSVIALSLLQLRDASRRPDAKQRPATEFIDPAYVETLCLWRHADARRDWSLHDFYYALARLGGHQNRKNDHPPGWLILWRGWTKLQIMTQAHELKIHRSKRCG
jgi:Transposase DNA-binding